MAVMRFIAAVSPHQPDGNFPEVPGKARQSSYQTFPDGVSEAPQTPANHPSDFLFARPERACPAELDRPARIIAWGHIALLTREYRGPSFSASPGLELRATTTL